MNSEIRLMTVIVESSKCSEWITSLKFFRNEGSELIHKLSFCRTFGFAVIYFQQKFC